MWGAPTPPPTPLARSSPTCPLPTGDPEGYRKGTSLAWVMAPLPLDVRIRVSPLGFPSMPNGRVTRTFSAQPSRGRLTHERRIAPSGVMAMAGEDAFGMVIRSPVR